MTRRTALPLISAVLALALAGVIPANAAGTATRGMSIKRSVDAQVAAAAARAKPYFNEGGLECTVARTGFNTNLDCDEVLPNNEPDIEVDPTDSNHMIASSNDYGSCCDEFYTTFDGGQTWHTGNMSNEGNRRIGSDPVTVFDVKNTRAGDPTRAIHASLNFVVNRHGACDGDLVVSISKDGGLTWGRPVVVADGEGCDDDAFQLFHDKEWIVTDNNRQSPFYGRTYVTWSGFVSENGQYVSSAIYEAHSDDGGQTWSPPKVISGFNSDLCQFQESGPAGECDENQFSVPTVTPDGNVYVAFENEQNLALADHGKFDFDDQYLVVSSQDGGETFSSPRFVVGLEDGFKDYPFNVNGRQTLTGYQIRVNSAGNIVADPNTGKLYLVFSDNRAGAHDTTIPVTNTNVYMMTSDDGATSWDGPFVVSDAPSDQWFPWAEVNPVTGEVGVLYNDRRWPDHSVHNVVLAEGTPGAFAHTTVSTRPSHVRDSVFFRAGVEGCRDCATFHGDYINISYGPDGSSNMVWTDMRVYRKVAHGYLQFIFFARIP